jgi:thiol-disulfide isomerase/thioredoxin
MPDVDTKISNVGRRNRTEKHVIRLFENNVVIIITMVEPTTGTTPPVLILIDASVDSLTVSWPETTAGAPYTLQYRRATDNGNTITHHREDDVVEDHGDSSSAFETLSTALTSAQARKRNLAGQAGFFFRVRSTNTPDNAGWTTHPEPFRLLTRDEEQRRLAAPTVTLAGSHSTLRIAWEDDAATTDATTPSYEVQMREAKAGAPWTTILASGGGAGRQVRKKNLTSPLGYQFRVRYDISSLPQRPGPDQYDAPPPFSPPSATMVALGFSPGLQRWFQNCNTLVRPGNPSTSIAVANALGGKEFVLLYASAHWCGPCRQFTPRLVQWYQQQQEKLVEVVFLSADHDENGFKSYFIGSGMPWWAVHYDENDAREQLMAQIRVTGIPRLVVLDGRTGGIVVDNAVGQPLDVAQWRKLRTSGN